MKSIFDSGCFAYLTTLKLFNQDNDVLMKGERENGTVFSDDSVFKKTKG